MKDGFGTAPLHAIMVCCERNVTADVRSDCRPCAIVPPWLRQGGTSFLNHSPSRFLQHPVSRHEPQRLQQVATLASNVWGQQATKE